MNINKVTTIKQKNNINIHVHIQKSIKLRRNKKSNKFFI